MGANILKKGFASLSLKEGIRSLSFKNTELNDLRKIICLRKSEAYVERISVCNVIEILAEHDIHCLSCSNTNDVIDLLP